MVSQEREEELGGEEASGEEKSSGEMEGEIGVVEMGEAEDEEEI